MKVQATLRHLRRSPKKVRLVADVIRGMQVTKAQHQLKFINKGASAPLLKLLNSAIANAEHNFSLSKDNLFVKEIRVDGAGMLRRWMPRAHGRATPLRKRMSHILITLDEITPTKVKKTAKDTGAKVAKKVKDQPKEVPQKKAAKPHDEQVPHGHEKELAHDVIDPRMEGKHRHNQHADKRSMKGKGGTTKKIFNRKSG